MENEASRSNAPLSPSHGACRNAVCEGGSSPCLEIAWIVTLSLQFTEVADTTSAMVRLVPMISIVSPGRQAEGAVQGSCEYREDPNSPSRGGGEAGAGLPKASTTASAVIVRPSVARRWMDPECASRLTSTISARTRLSCTLGLADRSAWASEDSRYSPYSARGRKSSAVAYGRRRRANVRNSSGSRGFADMRPAGTFSRYLYSRSA